MINDKRIPDAREKLDEGDDKTSMSLENYVKQYDSDVMVVFATQWVMPYNDFTLTDPDRIVIDIYK